MNWGIFIGLDWIVGAILFLLGVILLFAAVYVTFFTWWGFVIIPCAVMIAVGRHMEKNKRNT